MRFLDWTNSTKLDLTFKQKKGDGTKHLHLCFPRDFPLPSSKVATYLIDFFYALLYLSVYYGSKDTHLDAAVSYVNLFSCIVMPVANAVRNAISKEFA